jgi:autophagy-related protein 17
MLHGAAAGGAAPPRPPSSHSYANRPVHSRTQSRDYEDHPLLQHAAPPVSIETLVEHLLAAKRSLSTMTLILRADEIARLARASHEESVILAAESEYLRRGIAGQLGLLSRVQRALTRTKEGGKREFKMLTKMMDSTGGKLTQTMTTLRNTIVERELQRETAGDDQMGQSGEGALADKTLMDFIDENGVNEMMEELRKSLHQLKVGYRASRHLCRGH